MERTENTAGRWGLPDKPPQSNETILNLAFLCEDESYFTEYATVYAYPSNAEAVQQAKDAFMREERSRGRIDKLVKWVVVVEDHFTLMEILEGMWDDDQASDG